MRSKADAVPPLTEPVLLSATPQSLMDAVADLKYFLQTAPTSFPVSSANDDEHLTWEERCLNRFSLPTGENISCVLWNGLYHITGTDIVRALNFRFTAFGRPVKNVKKFEEGVFSDLRNLKSGTDASLEEPKSDFLEFLFKHNCIRTQKKQKVFYWFSVPHDRLFLDALDRDLKREKLGMEATTQAVREPALSFEYNPSKSLYEQFVKTQTDLKTLDETATDYASESTKRSHSEAFEVASPPSSITEGKSDLVFGAVSLFEGSPTYKQRRKQTATTLRRGTKAVSPPDDELWPLPDGFGAAIMPNMQNAPANTIMLRGSSSPLPYASTYSSAPIISDGMSAPLSNACASYDYRRCASPPIPSTSLPNVVLSQHPLPSVQYESFPTVWSQSQAATAASQLEQTTQCGPIARFRSHKDNLTATHAPGAPMHDVSASAHQPLLTQHHSHVTQPWWFLPAETGQNFHFPRSGSVDVARLTYEPYPSNRRYRSATPSIRRSRTSPSHPAGRPANQQGASPLPFHLQSPAQDQSLPFSHPSPFDGHLQAINELAARDVCSVSDTEKGAYTIDRIGAGSDETSLHYPNPFDFAFPPQSLSPFPALQTNSFSTTTIPISQQAYQETQRDYES